MIHLKDDKTILHGRALDELNIVWPTSLMNIQILYDVFFQLLNTSEFQFDSEINKSDYVYHTLESTGTKQVYGSRKLWEP